MGLSPPGPVTAPLVIGASAWHQIGPGTGLLCTAARSMIVGSQVTTVSTPSNVAARPAAGPGASCRPSTARALARPRNQHQQSGAARAAEPQGGLQRSGIAEVGHRVARAGRAGAEDTRLFPAVRGRRHCPAAGGIALQRRLGAVGGRPAPAQQSMVGGRLQQDQPAALLGAVHMLRRMA